MGRPRIAITKRRCIIVLMLLLAGGAIVNVAVAWGLSCYVVELQKDQIAAREPIAFAPDGSIIEYTEVSRWSGRGSLAFATSRVRTKGIDRPYVVDAPRPGDFRPKWARPSRLLEDLPSEGTGVDTEIACARGWPLISMMCRVDLPTERRDTLKIRMAIDMRGSQAQGAPPILLPLRPLWPGFAINSVFYAAIVWLLFAAPFALRRRRRSKRGLCVKCAYDLRGRAPMSDVCPECGAAREVKS